MNLFLWFILIIMIGLLAFRQVVVPRAVGKGGHLINFKTLTPPSSPNYYLVCPPNFCKHQPNQISPEYAVNVENLEKAWEKVLQKQPNTNRLMADDGSHQAVYVQLSKFFHFPDFINVQFIPLDENRSTLAVYSRAYFGYSDFNVNAKRVKAWLHQLEALVR